MIFTFIVVVWLMSTTTGITVEEVTTPDVRFDHRFESMITHPSDPRLLVVIDRSSVWTFDPVTKKKSFIAGSSNRGYKEGKGSDARFNFPYDSTHFNDTTIIITDYYNHCVRLVNIVAQLTERYAGVCKSLGSNDGDRLIAKFRYPWGSTRVGDTFYVCDYGDNKIRQISGNTVSTLVSGLEDRPRGLTSIDNKLIYTTQKNLYEFGLKTRTNTLIDGDLYPGLKSMPFTYLNDVVALTDKIFIAADYGNQTVFIIDTDKQIITATAKLSSSPFSLLLYNSAVLVGLDNGKIMRFSLTELSEMSSMIRKVQLVAEYPIKCQSLSKLSLNIIDSHLFQHTQNIRKYCAVCQVDSSPSPLTQCTDDTLIASWNTDITGDQQVSSDDIRTKLHSALVEFQNKYPVMDITIFTTVPRTASPVKDQAGLYLRVKITTICADKNFLYNKKLDVCVRTNH